MVAGHAVIVLDEKLNIWQVSEAAEKLSGWQQREIAGSPAEEILYTSSEDSGPEQSASLEKAIEQKRTSSGRAAIVTKTGALLPVSATVFPLMKEPDELVGAVVVLVDLRAQEELDRVTSDFLRGGTERIRSLDTIEGFVTLPSGELEELYEKQRERMLELENTLAELEKRKQVQENLVQKILSAQEDERKRVSHDIHDDLLQPVITAQYQLQIIKELTDNGDVIAKVDRLMALLDTAVSSTRHLLSDLRPVLLDEMGLKTTIERLLESFGRENQIKVAVQIQELPGLSSTLETIAFRIVQEALVNVKKHAKATELQVGIEARDGFLIISVRDNGQGFEVENVLAGGALSKNIGLEAMKERAQMVEGRLEIKTSPGKGTEIEARLPL